MRVEIKSFSTRAVQITTLAEQVAADLRSGLLQSGHASLAVPGGTTPAAFLNALAEQELDWKNVYATLTDERWVPPSHERSNERLLRGTLLTQRAAAVRFLPLYAEAPDPELALARVVETLEVIWPLTTCVLGMGNDAHTASLFPGVDRLDEALDPRCTATVLPVRAPGAVEKRITLTARALLTAAHTYLLITGAEKRLVLDQALKDGPVADAPIRAILRGSNLVTVFYAP